MCIHMCECVYTHTPENQADSAAPRTPLAFARFGPFRFAAEPALPA